MHNFSGELCTQQASLGQFGVYDLRLDGEGKKCTFEETLAPIDGDLALLYAFLILVAVAVVYKVLAKLAAAGKFDSLINACKNGLRDLGFEVSE